jgi:hypothetical protein
MTAAIKYAIVNESHAAEVTIPWLSTGICDMQDAYDGPFASVWGVLPIEIVLGDPGDGSARIFHLVDLIPEAPDALAYHTVDDQGRPVLKLGVETIRSSLGAGQNLQDELTKAMTHEIFETAIDPFATLYCWISGKPLMLSYEVCDPVQGGSFKQGSSAISNFVYPAYFDQEDTQGPYDQCRQLSAPLSCAPDGYQAWSDGSQTFGEKLSERKRAQARAYGRRVRPATRP